MTWLRWIFWQLAPCRHVDAAGASLTYRERRRLPGTKTDVLHLVCDRCGHAAPMVDRSPREQQRVVKIGRARNHSAARRAGPAAAPLPFESRRPAK